MFAGLVWVIAGAMPSTAQQTDQTVLVVRGAVQEPLTLTLSNLLTLPRVSVMTRDKDGAEIAFEGVALHELISRAKPMLTEKCCSNAVNTVIVIRAADNYQALFSLPELDPKFSDRQILLADRRAGKPLNPAQGPLQLVVPDEKAHARWVRQVTLIEVLPLGDVSKNSVSAASR